MTPWTNLKTELDAWSNNGDIATFWWRDDDAVTLTDALSRLYNQSCTFDIPLTLAVIPNDADDTLIKNLDTPDGLSLVQHGFAHVNHASTDEKKSEFGVNRNATNVRDDIAKGRARLTSFTGFFPAFVPPWNRFHSRYYEQLVECGIVGVSTFGARNTVNPVQGLNQTNTHADIMDWRGTRDFVGAASACTQIVNHLHARRSNTCDRLEPTGLLTHHLVHTTACWAFLDELFQFLRGHAAVRWLSGPEAFAT